MGSHHGFFVLRGRTLALLASALLFAASMSSASAASASSASAATAHSTRVIDPIAHIANATTSVQHGVQRRSTRHHRRALARRHRRGAHRRRGRREVRRSESAHGARAGRHRGHRSSTSAKAAVLASVLQAPCTGAELTPTPQDIQTVTAATLCLVNQERARNGVLPLQTNAQLAAAALEHDQEMVDQDFFAHVSPNGSTPVDRVRASGYIPNEQVGYTVGENIAWATLQLSTPAAIVAAWIASPEHLANILDAEYKETGVAVVPAVPGSLGAGEPGATYAQTFGVIVTG